MGGGGHSMRGQDRESRESSLEGTGRSGDPPWIGQRMEAREPSLEGQGREKREPSN